ncbi:MAG: ABC transporter permease subunit [archaeon]|jgi:ABC-type nitrate/sulfonate/bicarbonate transport system permease component|nr:ABC transporter permease subunit [archaeon]
MSAVYRYRFGILAATVVGFVLIWDAFAALVHNPFALAPPWGSAPYDVVYWFGQITYNPQIHALFVSSLSTTIVAIFEGFVLATVVGIPVGFIMGRYIIADYVLDPWVNAWYSIPAVAFVPLVMNWFGQSSIATVLVAFLIAVFSIIINVYEGVKNVSNSLVEPAMSFGANQTQMIYKVIFPASLPSIMVGLRIGISRSIDGVIIAEMIFTVVGFGGMIFDAADKLELGLAVALVIVLAILSIALNEMMKRLTKYVVAWKESAAMAR